MDTPRWQQLLAHPDQIDPSGVDIAVIADAGEAGYRDALARWNTLRFGTDRVAHAAIAYILAEAFEDNRGLDEIADSWDGIIPDEIAMRAMIGEPSTRLTAAFGPKIVHALRERLESSDSTSLPEEAARAARLLHPDDGGRVYLALRRKVVADVSPNETDAAERVADDLLIAAAAGSPDRSEVRRTVLAYWGEEPPLDAVPTAEPAPGESPAAWDATCELIARSQQPSFADRVIEIAFADHDAWNGHGSDAELLVRALGKSSGSTADARLLEIAKAQVPMSGLAVRTLAERRRRLAGAEPEMMARLKAIIVGMREHGVLDATPGPKTRLALAKDRSAEESPNKVATVVAEALGRPTGEALAPEWASFAAWLETAQLPGPTPVPPAPARRRSEDRGFGRLFGRR